MIGDLVSSRHVVDRAGLHTRLETVLEDVNSRMSPTVPLRITVGDEYQGCFASVGDAVHATLLVRALMRDQADVRHGIGWGPVAVLRADPRVEDGPGWWAARAAIDGVKRDSGRAATRSVRTAYRRADGVAGAAPDAINAALLCRDHIVTSASARSVAILQGLLVGRTQIELAAAEGVSSSAISQRVRRDGLGVVLAADALTRGAR